MRKVMEASDGVQGVGSKKGEDWQTQLEENYGGGMGERKENGWDFRKGKSVK